MTYYSTITTKGQLTLPADIRNRLHIKPGQKVAISLNDRGEAVITPTLSLEELRKKTYASLQERGITEDQVREMAQNYQDGDGYTAAVKERYGQR